MAGQTPDHEGGLGGGFGSSITFSARRAAAAGAAAQQASPGGAAGTETLMTRVFGSKNAPNQRVSESLDYEPVQNKIFYERMRQAKKERHLFGWVSAAQLCSHAFGMTVGRSGWVSTLLQPAHLLPHLTLKQVHGPHSGQVHHHHGVRRAHRRVCSGAVVQRRCPDRMEAAHHPIPAR